MADTTQKEFSLFDYYTMTNKPSVLICYHGPVNTAILHEISKDIKEKFPQDTFLGKRMFSIYIELAQNILYYSAEKNLLNSQLDSVGTILLKQTDKRYIFSCGNLVENQYIDELIDNCEEINHTLRNDRSKLREAKRQQLQSKPKARSKGAGIGLIQVALTSRNPLTAEYRRIDDLHSFFSLVVKVDKD